MKTILSLLVLVFSLSAFAGSGSSAVTLVLEQPEVLKLEDDLRLKGFTLSNIKDHFATAGVQPRCPCISLGLTFRRVSGGVGEEKSYNVNARGLGTNLQVTIQPK